MKQTLQKTGVVLLLISVLITVALLVSPLMLTGSYAYGKTKTVLQNTAPTIESFRLINAETNEAIGAFDPLLDGAVLALDNLPTTALNIQANGDAANIGSVQFLLNGEVVRTENDAPFALAGDRNGNYQSWTPTVGSYTLTAIPFSDANGSGTAGTALTIHFTVVATQSVPATPTATSAPTSTPTKMAVLVFSKTTGFRHNSISAGQAALETLGTTHNFDLTLSEDATIFTDAALASFQVVVFLNTTGDILDATQQAAFERFIQAGGGFVGIHSATDTEYDWPWYGGLVVSHMSNHSPVVQASLAVVHDAHRAEAGLPATWSRVDEWYNFQSNPSAAGVELLVTVDESSYSGGTMGNPHPIAWRHQYDGGRAWYTAMGHTPESFDEPFFRRHLLDGILWAAAQGGVPGSVTGTLVKWHPITISFQGPTAAESDLNPNPFLDYRLQVTMVSPSGKTTVVPGFFAGDGAGNGSGTVWQVRFAPNEAGTWRYQASFRTGQAVAVDLAPNAGEGTSFDSAEGQFTVADRDPNAPGFLSVGRLAYTADHYLKFEDGPYWIKGGTDSPENFLGYAGFDNTVDQGGRVSNFLHTYSTHRADWVNGDPTFAGANGDDGKGIIGALNYLATQRVNSIYFLPMNLGGDGQETYPFISPNNTNEAKTHYDISKLYQWNAVFAHAQRKGIALHIVLNETEQPNEAWLDNGALGVERKLFYRELIARYGYLLAIKWNLSEENDFPVASLQSFADYIGALDWANHPIAVHTRPNNFADYEQIEGDSRFSATSIQYNPDRAGGYVETWRSRSRAAGRPWILDMDENNPAGEGLTDANAADLRKRVLYDVYFSGGNLEWYAGYHGLPLGGDLRLEDFRTREEMWQYMWYARRFMADNLPFWRMDPADELLTGEMTTLGGGEVFAAVGEIYAIYLPNAASGTATLDLTAVSATEQFTSRWYNPRTGEFAGQGPGGTGGGTMALGVPPAEATEDWVLLVQRSGGTFTPTPTLTPMPGATPTSTPVLGATPTPTSTSITGTTLTPTSVTGATPTPISTPITGATPTPTVTLSATVQQTPIAGSTVIFYLPLLLN